jgi:hypothetical protein
MKKKPAKGEVTEKSERQPYRVHLPGFVSDDDIGLGDLLKRVTYAVGIKPCGGCERRAAALNRRMVFSGKR